MLGYDYCLNKASIICVGLRRKMWRFFSPVKTAMIYRLQRQLASFVCGETIFIVFSLNFFLCRFCYQASKTSAFSLKNLCRLNYHKHVLCASQLILHTHFSTLINISIFIFPFNSRHFLRRSHTMTIYSIIIPFSTLLTPIHSIWYFATFYFPLLCVRM